MSYDLLIKNGTIVDGSGAPSYQGDVAVKGDQIVAVGEVDAERASRTIDAEGKLVTPGFVDIHTPLGGCHEREPPGSAGDHCAHIELVCNYAALFDINSPYLLACWACLVGY